jgi:hypothetical protein
LLPDSDPSPFKKLADAALAKPRIQFRLEFGCVSGVREQLLHWQTEYEKAETYALLAILKKADAYSIMSRLPTDMQNNIAKYLRR